MRTRSPLTSDGRVERTANSIWPGANPAAARVNGSAPTTTGPSAGGIGSDGNGGGVDTPDARLAPTGEAVARMPSMAAQTRPQAATARPRPAALLKEAAEPPRRHARDTGILPCRPRTIPNY